MSDKCPETHPALYKEADAPQRQYPYPRSDQDGSQGDDHALQVLEIVDAGRDRQGRATARVWHLDREGTFMAGSVVLVLDAESGAPLASGSANMVGGGLCPAATRSEDALPAPRRITTIGFYHAQPTPNVATRFGMIVRTDTIPAAHDGDADVTDPRIRPTAGNRGVKIGLARPGPAADCDYAYANAAAWVDGQPVSLPLLVPFTGTWNAQQALDVDPQGVFKRPCGLDSKIFPIGGNVYSELAGSADPAKVTGDEASSIVTWKWVFNGNDTPANTTSLVYTTLPAASSEGSSPPANPAGLVPVRCAFYFRFLIPVIADPDKAVMTVCSKDWHDEPSVQCTQIDTLEFWWHCLAEGTRVTLSDGSTRPIEEVDNTCRVRTGHGNGSLGVEATSRGVRHQVNPEDPATAIYRLESAGGRVLVLTGGHPVVTEDGLVSASDLRPGMTIHAGDGLDMVADISAIDSDALFCNLKLIDANDRARGLGSTIGTFFANGLLVGDHSSMEMLHQFNTHSHDYMMPRIPEHLRDDYASTLAAIARDNAKYGCALPERLLRM